MVSLGTHPAIERAGLVTPRLPVRALNFYPDNRMHGSEGGEGESPSRPLSKADRATSRTSRSVHSSRELKSPRLMAAG